MGGLTVVSVVLDVSIYRRCHDILHTSSINDGSSHTELASGNKQKMLLLAYSFLPTSFPEIGSKCPEKDIGFAV